MTATSAELVFKAVFCLFTVIGASLSLGPVIGFSDAMISMMAIPNVIGLYLLARVVRNEVKGHRSRVDTGEFARVK